MAAISSESVETMTESKTPLSTAGAIVYAIAGWPLRTRTFFPGTRFDPCRAGMRATAEGTTRCLYLTRVVIDVNRFQIGVDIKRLRARLAPAVARLPQAAKRHVRLAAVGAA